MSSYTAFLADFAIDYDKHISTTPPNKCQRMGQFYMNCLHDVRPDIFVKLLNTDGDPFYLLHDLPEGLHKTVEALW